MSEKLPPLDVLQDMAKDKGIELPEDILDEVAGGAYTYEEWYNMSDEERKAAQNRSIFAKVVLKAPCELD